jgi:very-short-patch-repair endonuclease
VKRSSTPGLWEKLKPLVRQMRTEPTHAEQALWQHLRSRQLCECKFRRQHAIDRFVVDFYCAERDMIIEVDGPVHDFTPEEDALRQEYLESLGFHVLRFTNQQVLENIDSVLQEIILFLEPPSSSPSP